MVINDSSLTKDIYDEVYTKLSTGTLVTGLSPKITGLYPDEKTNLSNPIITISPVTNAFSGSFFNGNTTYKFINELSCNIIVFSKKAIEVDQLCDAITYRFLTPISGLNLVSLSESENFVLINDQPVRSKTISVNWDRK